MSKLLSDAQNKQNEFLDKLTSSKELQNQRPVFHFATPGGWCNDPNGFSQFNGKIHLFYQYHPYSIQWGPMHWGHAVSEDFLNWQNETVALAPDSESDCKGCFSGTAIEYDGKHIIAYTGVSNNGKVDVQNQCIAIGDGITYRKIDANPVLTADNIPFEFNIEHFRDPKVWMKDEKFFMVCVIKQKNECGAMVMFESADAENWTYKGILDSSKDGLSKMWECPDVSVIDGKDVLIFSPQEVNENYELGFHDGNNSVYVTGKLDYHNFSFKREVRSENNYTAALVDYGIDFYAPETTKLSDGRIIMMGWMQAWESYITPENYTWSGMMTLPRELYIKNNRLYQKPVREFELWKKDNVLGECKVSERIIIANNYKRSFELDLDFSAVKNQKGSVKVILEKNKQQVYFKIDLDEESIFFDRSTSLTPGTIKDRRAKLRIDGKLSSVKIIVDTCSMEVFINEGIQTFTNSFFFSDLDSDLVIENSTSEKLKYEFYKVEQQKIKFQNSLT